MTGRHSVKRPITLCIRPGILTLPGHHGLDPVAARERFVPPWDVTVVTLDGNFTPSVELQRMRRILGSTP